MSAKRAETPTAPVAASLLVAATLVPPIGSPSLDAIFPDQKGLLGPQHVDRLRRRYISGDDDEDSTSKIEPHASDVVLSRRDFLNGIVRVPLNKIQIRGFTPVVPEDKRCVAEVLGFSSDDEQLSFDTHEVTVTERGRSSSMTTHFNADIMFVELAAD